MPDDHEIVRRGYQELMLRRAEEARDRLSWSVDERRSFANDRLGELLEFASSRSEWHRNRLAGIELGAVTIDDLSSLPTMNKRDLADGWNAIVTDSRLTIERANRHLDDLKANGFSFAAGHYVIYATGGSTGFRSVIASDAEGFAAWAANNIAHNRSSEARVSTTGVPVQGRLTATSPIHISGAISAIAQGATSSFVTVPPSMPIAEGVALLNETQPDVLAGYGSMLQLMALEALAGRLRITPSRVSNAGEPLMPETRDLVRAAFGLEISNLYGASEAFFAQSWRGSELLHLGDDTVVFELVDADNQPVPPGTRSTKMLITNLANRVQPLIRYEITDEVTEADLDPAAADPAARPPGPWAGRWIHAPQGRNDDWFNYDGIVVHPHVFRSTLGAEANIAEYQVRQTRDGADIVAVTVDDVDRTRLASAIADELRILGLDRPRVRIEAVAGIERHPGSGKLRRFIPIV